MPGSKDNVVTLTKAVAPMAPLSRLMGKGKQRFSLFHGHFKGTRDEIN